MSPTRGAAAAPEGPEPSPSARIDQKIDALADWRGHLLSRLRGLILGAGPDVQEQVKWVKPANPMGVPVWVHQGILCTGEIYKDKVKLTFAQGAALDDPAGLFNCVGTGRVRRAIDLFEGDEIDAEAFQALVRAAATWNAASKG